MQHSDHLQAPIAATGVPSAPGRRHGRQWRHSWLAIAAACIVAAIDGAATAQPAVNQPRAQELMDLIRQGLEARDPEAKIRHMTAAKKLEPQVANWTLDMPRKRANGLIRGVLGNGYKDRTAGDKASNVTEAVAAFRDALRFQSAQEFPGDFAVTQKNLCNILYQKFNLPSGSTADLEDAREACLAALPAYKAQNDAKGWADSLFDLGNIYSERIKDGRGRNLSSAARAYKAAATFYTKERAPQKWAEIQNNIGVVYFLESNKDSATRMSDYMTGLRTDNLDIAFQGPTLLRGLNAYSRQKAIDAFKASLTVYSRTDNPERFAGSQNSLAILYRNGQQTSGQIAAAREALVVMTLERDPVANLRLTTILAQGLMAERKWQDAATAYGQARRAFQALARRSPDTFGKTASLFGPLHTEAAFVAIQLGDLWGGLRILEEQSTALIGDQNASDPIESAGRAIPVGGMALVPVITDAGSKLVAVVRPSEGPASVSAVDIPDVDLPLVTTTIRDWLRAFNIQYLPGDKQGAAAPHWHDAIERIGPVLSDRFGKAIAALLSRHAIKPGSRLIWMPSAMLAVLPAGMIADSDSRERIGDRFVMTFAPSLHALSRASAAAGSPDRSIALVVNPTGEDADLDLPFAEMEAEFVARHFSEKQRTVLGKIDADVEAVLAGMQGKAYWHFASHGEFDWEAPARSGLLMRGRKRLTIEQLLASGTQLGRPKLVVLSACETGIYDMRVDPQSYQGLPAAFLRLGAGGVVASLWQVDDIATSLLMARFYDAVLADGKAPAEGLKTAQAWLRNASAEEVTAYTRSGQSTLTTTMARTIETAMSTGRRSTKSRFSPSWALLQKRSGQPVPGPTDRKARPFEHPFYWAGFVLTGT